MMAGKITIQDIARLAGVSKATVSRVLNQKSNVDPMTRERILRIIEQHNFVPNIAATGLAGGRSRLIGVLVPSFTWPFIPEIMRGISNVIEKTSFELILYSISDVNHEKVRNEVIDHIMETNLTSGLLAVFPGPSSYYLSHLHKPEFPVVLLDDQSLPLRNIPWVGINNRQGAYEATKHLILLGHHRIAHIQGPLKYQVSQDRYQGYCEALQEAGMAIDPSLVMEGNFMPSSGRSCARAFFDLIDRPTAIFAASDYLAYGVIAAAEEYNLRIPLDLALVGFDDIASSAHIRPPLTTVRQPFYEMGQCAINVLLSLIDPQHPCKSDQVDEEHSSYRDPLHIELETTLIVRDSCGASSSLQSVSSIESSY
jgi:LacI family transcriptional regulator